MHYCCGNNPSVGEQKRPKQGKYGVRSGQSAVNNQVEIDIAIRRIVVRSLINRLHASGSAPICVSVRNRCFVLLAGDPIRKPPISQVARGLHENDRQDNRKTQQVSDGTPIGEVNCGANGSSLVGLLVQDAVVILIRLDRPQTCGER